MNITDNFFLVLILIALISPFGIPLGATFFIISAGSLSDTVTDYVFFVTLIFIGFVIGDIAAYATASHFEKGLTRRLCEHEWYMKKCETTRFYFDKYGGLCVFLSRFLLTGLGAPVNYISGFSKYPFRKFFVFAASGEFLYAVIYTYIGFIFKDSWVYLYDVTAEFTFTIILFIAALLILYQLKRHLPGDRTRSVHGI